jgi:RNA polymerase sigma-70 factor (ECF subfamily)
LIRAMPALVLRPMFAVGHLPGRRAAAGSSAAGRGRADSDAPLEPGEARRFRELFLPHLDGAYGFARYLTRDAAAAEDLTQDAFLAAYRNFRSYRGGQPKAWLFAILRSEFLGEARRARARPAAEGMAAEAEEVADPGETPEAGLLRAAEAADVRAAIEALPEPFREALVLRELQEMSYREIADITGSPIGTVMSRLARARGLLAAALGLGADR